MFPIYLYSKYLFSLFITAMNINFRYYLLAIEETRESTLKYRSHNSTSIIILFKVGEIQHQLNFPSLKEKQMSTFVNRKESTVELALILYFLIFQ